MRCPGAPAVLSTIVRLGPEHGAVTIALATRETSLASASPGLELIGLEPDNRDLATMGLVDQLLVELCRDVLVQGAQHTSGPDRGGARPAH